MPKKKSIVCVMDKAGKVACGQVVQGEFKYVVTGVIRGKRVEMRPFTEKKYASRYKNLIRVLGKEIPAKNIYTDVKVEKIS